MIMPNQWKEDQNFLLAAMSNYRVTIKDKIQKEARQLTLEFATQLHQSTRELQHRSIESINQRLPYLEIC
jgi:N-methylhydantoinase B/oxoprolinase/acetone carboxylase alpha subunit